MNIDDLLKQVEEMVVTNDDIGGLCERLDTITSLDTRIDLNFEYTI